MWWYHDGQKGLGGVQQISKPKDTSTSANGQWITLDIQKKNHPTT